MILPDRIKVMDAFAIFVMDRPVVLVATGDVITDPEFWCATFFFDQPDGFHHDQIESETGK